MRDLVFRDIAYSDISTVVALNEANIHFLSLMTLGAVRRFYDTAAYFRVAVLKDEIVGFAVSFDPKADYDSPNFRWFQARFAPFLYIDRVVIRNDWRRRGIGFGFYAEIERVAVFRGLEVLACEVDVRPPNPASMAFHTKYGFSEIGSQTIVDRDKTVSYQIKRVKSSSAFKGHKPNLKRN